MRASPAFGTLTAMDRFEDQVMKAFSSRLRKARASAGYEHAKVFAEALGVEPARYRHWERGTAQPDLTTLTRICRLLGVEANDLLPLTTRKAVAARGGGSATPSKAVA